MNTVTIKLNGQPNPEFTLTILVRNAVHTISEGFGKPRRFPSIAAAEEHAERFENMPHLKGVRLYSVIEEVS